MDSLLEQIRAIRPAATIETFSLPHPAALKQIASNFSETAQRLARSTSEGITSLASKTAGVMEAIPKATKFAEVAAVGVGAYNATERANKGYESVPSEVWLTQVGVFAVIGLVDVAGANAKTGFGDWEYIEELTQTYSKIGMTPEQQRLADALQKGR